MHYLNYNNGLLKNYYNKKLLNEFILFLKEDFENITTREEFFLKEYEDFSKINLKYNKFKIKIEEDFFINEDLKRYLVFVYGEEEIESKFLIFKNF